MPIDLAVTLRYLRALDAMKSVDPVTYRHFMDELCSTINQIEDLVAPMETLKPESLTPGEQLWKRMANMVAWAERKPPDQGSAISAG